MAKCGKVDYSKSLIYKLCCKDVNINEIYVGSTTNLIKRKYKHKYDCNNINSKSYNHYVYRFVRENGGFQNWSMIIIENYPCENKRELEKRERYWLEQLDATLNSIKPFTTEEEIKEQVKECKKKYYENNKEKQKEYQKNYQKNYKEINKDKIKEYNKLINEKNKKEIYNCVCGSNIKLVEKKRHLKSKKHLDYIKIIF